MATFEGHHIISEQIRADELAVLLRELKQVLTNAIDGAVVELGCYEGTSALFLQRYIEKYSPEKKLWLYDSFEGLPEKTDQDVSALGEAFKVGELKASKAELQRNFVKAGLKLPEIKKAWFWELTDSDLPDTICYAFLDGDFYESILQSLDLIWPRMSKGGCIVIDDYQNAKLPGAKRAVDEFCAKQNLGVRAEKTLAIINL